MSTATPCAWEALGVSTPPAARAAGRPGKPGSLGTWVARLAQLGCSLSAAKSLESPVLRRLREVALV